MSNINSGVIPQYLLNKIDDFYKFLSMYKKFDSVSVPEPDRSDFSSVIDKTILSKCSLKETPGILTLELGDARIVLKMGSDITREKADFIVNAANEEMLGGGGVDGAIGAAGGEELFLFRQLVPEARPGVRCPVGEARLTDAGRLPASFCIHTVGPRFDLQHREACRAQLLNAYVNALKVADDCLNSLQSGNDFEGSLEEQLHQKGIEKPSSQVLDNAERLQKTHRENLKRKLDGNEPISISFPTISTGIFGYPREEGARLSLLAVLEYLQNHQGKPGVKTIQFVFLDQQADIPYYRQAFSEISRLFGSTQ